MPNFALDHDACGVGLITRLETGDGPAAASREPIERALTGLERLAHRGGFASDGVSGDGAGILVDLPREYLRAAAAEAGVRLPQRFAAGMAFLPDARRAAARFAIVAALEADGLECLGWREVPTRPACLGPVARERLPAIYQFFAARAGGEGGAWESHLLRARRRIAATAPEGTYIASLGERTITYKGLLAPGQLAEFYPDLGAAKFVARFAIFHLRFATNTEPSWRLAQPFRWLAHNGEINTIAANRRWLGLRAPEALEAGGSDSASLDNALEAELRRGRRLDEALRRLVPAAWENDAALTPGERAWWAAAAREQEAWDGPAAIVASDGRLAGARLDRNGLRPLRYTRTASGLLVLGSEVGIADLSGETVVERGRLGPGESLWVDLETGRSVERRWELKTEARAPRAEGRRQRAGGRGSGKEPWRLAGAFGLTQDQHKLLFGPLAATGRESVFSMGDDAPPAVLSAQPRLVWDYCKQRFAQVTNPPIDALREGAAMSLAVYWRTGEIASPLVDEMQWAEITAGEAAIEMTFASADGAPAGAQFDRLERAVAARIDAGACAIVLSDAGCDRERCALPAMLAAAAAWRAMAARGGHELPLWIATGQVWDTHHVAMLVAVGATGVYPYLAWELAELAAPATGCGNLRGGLEAGLYKVLARMGIATLASYRGGQLFETLGLEHETTERFFPAAAAYLGGTSLERLMAEARERHRAAFAGTTAATGPLALADAGLYRYRRGGEAHQIEPELVRRMHQFVRAPSAGGYAAYAELLRQRPPLAVRDLLTMRAAAPVAAEERESAAAIARRFSTQAMSLGAIAPEAQRALAEAMNRLGGRSNTGEGGEDAEAAGRDRARRHRVKQVASARFGVTAEYLLSAEEIEIKMAQGAKPGEGGQLPPAKVTPYIARLRHAVPGMALISPPPHHDIYSIEDLAQLIADLQALAPGARIGVKLVAGAGVGLIAAGVAKAGAEVITIAGGEGGTGASPLSSIKNTGLPWELGLHEAHRTLTELGLRGRVRLRADGGFKSGRDVVIAGLLGADEFGFGTAALVALGCVMARQCHLNTCPAGIATQDAGWRAKFAGRAEMLIAYFEAVAAEARAKLDELGASSLGAIRGRTDLLAPRDEAAARILGDWPGRRTAPAVAADHGARLRHGVRAASRGATVAPCDRSLGAAETGARMMRATPRVAAGWTMRTFHGSAGQSFGAFLGSGLRYVLHGEANDFVGKGLSGGEIAITAGAKAARRGDVLAGNAVLYGATAGRLFIAGRVGERFAVRNSGALAVVEGVGRHGCEYMTAGVAIVLGPGGGNFGAGMTGGLAYWLRAGAEKQRPNDAYVRQAEVTSREEAGWLRRALELHNQWTGSASGRELVRGWDEGAPPLVRIEPLRPACSVAETWHGLLPAATQERAQGAEDAETEAPRRGASLEAYS